MRLILLALVFTLVAVPAARSDNGMINVKSAHDVKTTADRLEKVLAQKGMTVFVRIDHAAGARKVGHSLRPTELVVFGNPAVGAPLMQCSQTVGIDLPQKALIWQDESGQVWFSYNHPAYLQERHGVKTCEAVLSKIGNALAKFAKAAAGP